MAFRSRRGGAGRRRVRSMRGRRRRSMRRRSVNPAKRIAKRRNRLVGDRM